MRINVTEINISLSEKISPGRLILIPNFIRCIHCNHEIPIGQIPLSSKLVCNGGCGRESIIMDYAVFFGKVIL